MHLRILGCDIIQSKVFFIWISIETFYKYFILNFLGRDAEFENYDVFEQDFEAFISMNSPLVITDYNADPFLCGNNGGPTNVCGHYVSEYAAKWRTFKPYM